MFSQGGQLTRISQNEFPAGKRGVLPERGRAVRQTKIADIAHQNPGFQSLNTIPTAAGSASASYAEKLQGENCMVVGVTGSGYKLSFCTHNCGYGTVTLTKFSNPSEAQFPHL